MGSERAGDYSSPSRNNASSTIEGKGDTTTVGVDLVFVWVVEIDLFFASGHRNWLNFRVGIEIDLIPVLRPKLSWFLCG